MLTDSEIRDLFERVTEEDGPVRVLIYRSTSAGTVEFVAHSLQYGQVAAGDTPDEALLDLVDQIVTYLAECRAAAGYRDTAGRRNLAPREVLLGYHLGRSFDADSGLAELPITVRLDVKQVYDDQGDDQLQTFVSAKIA